MSISTANPQVATLTRYRFVAVGSETSVSGIDANGNVLAYVAGKEQVYMNGVLLVRGQDYTATSGTSITGLTALAASDVIEVLTFSEFVIANAVDQNLVNAKGDLIVATADNTVTNLTVGANNTTLIADSTQASGVKWANGSVATLTNKGDLLGASAANTPTRVAVGTNNQVLMADSTQTSGVKYANEATATLTAKGDILTATAANTLSRLGVGTNGQVLKADSTTATGLAWGNAGVNWTPRQTGNGNPLNQIAYNGTNLWVAVGNAGSLYSSPDGITWTARTSGFGANNIFDVFFGNGLWVAVGQNGTITTSPDGITWTARTSNMSTNVIYAVTYANSLWVAVGNGGGTTNTGGITYSSDGLTWTRKSQSLTVGSVYYCVVWNGTNWVVGATPSTNNILYATTPSGIWTAAAVVVGGASAGTTAIQALFWDGTRHIYTNTSGADWTYSTSTTMASGVQMNGLTQGGTVSRCKLYTGTLYYVNGGYITGFVVSSTAYPSPITPIISGGAFWDATVPTLREGAVTIWVGAQGYIIGNNYGAIYTSF